MSQVSRDQPVVPGDAVDRVVEAVELSAQRCLRVVLGEQLGQAGSDQPGMDAGEEDRYPQAVVGDGVAVGAGEAFDQSVQAEPS